MSQILVNESFPVEGRISIETFRDRSQNPPVVHKTGVFVSSAPYIEVIDTLRTSRFFLEGVDVFRETMGSEDSEYGYEFTFTKATRINEENSTDCTTERV